MEKITNTPTTINKEDLIILREKFISEYSKNKGWDVNNLSTTQLLEIVEQPSYKSPGMILS
jgi:hypothetical protein